MSPKRQAAYWFSTVYIMCHSKSPVKWKTQKGKRLISYSQNVLVLNNVMEKDSGYYICEGTVDDSGRTFRAASEVLVGSKDDFFSLLFSFPKYCQMRSRFNDANYSG